MSCEYNFDNLANHEAYIGDRRCYRWLGSALTKPTQRQNDLAMILDLPFAYEVEILPSRSIGRRIRGPLGATRQSG